MTNAPGNTQSTHTLRLLADAASMKKGLDAVDKELGKVVKQLDRSQAAAARNAASNKVFIKSNKQMAAAMKSTANTNRALRASLQNTGYQVQDIAVQLSMGTSAVQSLSQQLPQLFSGFGLIGVALGTVAGVLGAVAVKTDLFGKSAVDSEKALEAFAESIVALNGTGEAATKTLAELRAQFGEFAADVKQGSISLNELALVDALQAQKVALEASAPTFDHIRENYEMMVKASNALTDTEQGRQMQAEAAALFADEILDTYGLEIIAAQKLVGLNDQYLKSVEDTAAQLRLANEFQAELIAQFGTLDKVPERLRDAAESMIRVAQASANLEASQIEVEKAVSKVATQYDDVLGSVEGLQAANDALNKQFADQLKDQERIASETNKLRE